MAQLPLIKVSDDLPVLMPRWKSQLDPLLANRLVGGQAVMGVHLSAVPTKVYHDLGQVPIGWILSDLDSNAVVFRSAPMTNTTVTLSASTGCTVNLWIY